MTGALRIVKEAPPVSRRGPLSNCPNYRVIVMQQAGAASAATAAASVTGRDRRCARQRHNCCNQKQIFHNSLLLRFRYSSGREYARSACVFCAEPNAMGENQIRGGGVGGRSIRADAVASWIAKVWPLKRGVGKLSEIGQKSISVEHETVQQLLGCDSCRHRS